MKKKVLVVGAAGFLASKFISKYKDKYRIISSIKSKKKKNFKLFKGTKIIIENILNKKKDYKPQKIDVVIYSVALDAAQSADNNLKSKKVNYEAVKVFCKYLKSNEVKKVIKLSTIKVYGKNPNFSLSEKSKFNPEDNYSKHILKSDMYLEKFCNKNKINFQILRVSNGFGVPAIKTKESSRVLVNSFVYQASLLKKIYISSQFNMVKNFIRIENIVDCIDFLIKKQNVPNGVYLLAGKSNYDLASIVRLIKKTFKKEFNKEIIIDYNFNKKKLNKNFKIEKNKIKKIGFNFIKKDKQEIIKLIKYYSKI